MPDTDDRPVVLDLSGLRESRKGPSSLERAFDKMVAENGLPVPEAEYRFWPGRQFRFDRAYPESRIAVELEGGVFGRPCPLCKRPPTGGHTSIEGVLRDCEKYNEASIRGWTVLRITAKTIGNGAALMTLARALSEKGVITRQEALAIVTKPKPAPKSRRQPPQRGRSSR